MATERLLQNKCKPRGRAAEHRTTIALRGGSKHPKAANLPRKALGPGRHIYRDGHWIPAGDARQRRKQADNKDFESNALGCHPNQVEDFNRRFGDLGVRYSSDGKCHLPDRQAKLALMRRRGMVDFDEVQG